MIDIGYALRDDPLNIYMISDCVAENNRYTQIFLMRKKEISPTFLDKYFYLDSKKEDKIGLSDFGKEISQKRWENPYTYIACVDSQIEFQVSRGVFDKLIDALYPVWTPEKLLSYYDDQQYGFLVLLKVYRVPEKLDVSLLQKGRLGSALIMRLYDEAEIETEVSVSNPIQLITNSKFSQIKAEILHLLKREDSYIDLFENDEEDIKRLQSHIEAMRLLRPSYEREYEYDLENPIDYAQSDYDVLYSQALEIAPGLAMFVEFVKSTPPPQFGEIDDLIESVSKGDRNAKNRIIEMNLRVCLRNALWASSRYKVDLEDALQEAIIGLISSIDKFLESSSTLKFSNYFPWWVRQNMIRELPIAERTFHLPSHMREKIQPLLDAYEVHDCDECREGNFCDEMISTVSNMYSCDGDKAVDYLNRFAIGTESFESLSNDACVRPMIENDWENLLDSIMLQSLKEDVNEMLGDLPERQRDIIEKRNGFRGKVYTLEELGSEYQLTRERIRQIETKAYHRLCSIKHKKILFDYYNEL